MRSRGPLTQKGNQLHAGGYSKEKQAILNAIKLPDRLGCCDCLKTYALWKYSENNQKLLRNAIATGRVNLNKLDQEAWIRVKGLDGFTKAQRRDPDNARCIECVAGHRMDLEEQDEKEDEEDLHPEEGEGDDDGDSESNLHAESEFGDSESGAGGAPVPSQGRSRGSSQKSQAELNTANLAKLNFASGISSSKTSTSVRDSLASKGATGSRAPSLAVRGWQQMSGSHGGKPEQGAKFTAYDPSGKAHQMVHAPSTAGDEEDSDEDDSDSRDTVKDVAGSSFRSTASEAAILGRRKEQIAPPRYTGQTVEAYHDDEEEDDDEDFFSI
ncbi:hypothetical protein P7C71_g5990, partial [Lecanoromycetidae sp. Uapishka_2]